MNNSNYPVQYIIPVQLPDGTLVQLRPVHPADGQQARAFKSTLSVESIYARFHGYEPAVSEKLVKRLTEIDYTKEMAIVAEILEDREKEAIGIARIAGDGSSAIEFAIIISDEWHGKKLGGILTRYMIKIAREMGYASIYAMVLKENEAMLAIMKKLGFQLRPEDGTTMKAFLEL